MTIVINTLVGTFEYPPTTVGWLIKHFWTLGTVPTFLITDANDSMDKWYDGEPPAIIFRSLGDGAMEENKAIGDTLFYCKFSVQVHIFAISKFQQFQFQNEIRRIIKENRRNPIIKWSEYVGGSPPQNDSGLKIIEPTSPVWKQAEDTQDNTDNSETHSVGTLKACWYEHRV